MSQDFVRYTPQIETVDPNLDRLLEPIIAFWEKKVRTSPVEEGSGRALRGAHAKTFGVVKAEVQILRNVPPAYAQGIYAKPGHHGALIRFSSASNHLGADATLGGILGLAMKIFDVPGSKLVEDEPDSATFDLVLKNNPIFVANTAKHYLVIQEVGNDAPKYLARGKTGFHELLRDYLTGKGTFEQSDWAWEELFAFVKLSQTPVRNPLLTTYWSMAAFRQVNTSPRSASRRPRKTPAVSSIVSSTYALGRTCFIPRWWMSFRPARSISTSRCSFAPISRPCRSTTLRSNGRKSSLPS